MKKAGIESGEIRMLRIDELIHAPVPIHVHSQKQMNHISAKLLKNEQEKTILVAALGDQMYIIDGHLMAEVYRRNGREAIAARVCTAKNEQEVIAMHIRHNMSNPPNPVQLLEAIMYMRERSETDEEICDSLNMNKGTAGILKLSVNADALNEMRGVIKDVSTVYYSIHHTFPMYLLEWVFKQHIERQHDAAIALRQVVVDSCRGLEHKFVWPTIMEVRIRQSYNGDDRDADAGPVGIPLRVHSDGARGRPLGSSSASDIIKEAPGTSELSHINDNTPTSRRRVVFKCPHGSVMYVDGKSRAYHLDDEGADNVTYMRRLDGEEGVYQISGRTLRFLRAKNGKVCLKECTPAQLAKLLTKVKKGRINVCILSSENL